MTTNSSTEAADLLAWMAAQPISILLADVAPALRLEGDRLLVPLGEVLNGGLAEVWGVEPDLCLTLTPLGAARLGIRPDSESSRWVPIDVAEPRPVRRSPAGQDGPDNFEFLDSHPDPAAWSPDEAVAFTEAYEATAARMARRRNIYSGQVLPWPIHLLGLDRPWPFVGPDGLPWRRESGDPCPVCGHLGDAVFPDRAVCLCCHRYSYDRRIGYVAPMPPRDAPDASLSGGTGQANPGQSPKPTKRKKAKASKSKRKRKAARSAS